MKRSPLGELLSGAGYLGRGLRLWITSPGLMLLGALPALVVGLVYLAALVVFALNLEAIAVWVTPFAAGWDDGARLAVRLAAGVALVAVVVLLAVYTFVAVTLAVGDPFYERIWRSVENRLGSPPPESDEAFWVSARRGIGTGVRILVLTLAIGILVFALGLLPVVGAVAAPVAAAVAGGWTLSLELTGFAFDSRGASLRDRRRMLGARRTRTLGFGILSYLMFLVPFGAVVAMPAAVAGATMLARDSFTTAPPQAPAT